MAFNTEPLPLASSHGRDGRPSPLSIWEALLLIERMRLDVDRAEGDWTEILGWLESRVDS